MKHEYLTPFSTVAMFVVVLLVGDSGLALADRLTHYRVTIDNLTDQPLSSPVAITHQGSVDILQVGEAALAKPETIAEAGQVTQVIDIEAPVTPKGATTFMIIARPGDRLSLTTEAPCANAGFASLNRA